MAKRKKTGGRLKGSTNKTTKEMRSLLSSILSHEIECIPEYLESIDPEKKLQMLIKLLPYVLPFSTEPPENENKESDKDFFLRINDRCIEQNQLNKRQILDQIN